MSDPRVELEKAEKELVALQEKITAMRKAVAGEEVENHKLADPEGNPVRLYDLFGDKDDLIVVHNMGKGCRYCTLWADGFNGTYQHLEDRAGFVVVSHDPPDTVKQFASGRGWRFKVLSNNGGSFTKAMGYEKDDGKPMPGVSTFHRDSSGKVIRIAHTFFGPGDAFCPQWHFLDLLMDGADGWEPQYSY